MSAVWAVSMVRDEADVIAGTLQHMAEEGVEGIIVADNLSVDGTRDILADLTRDLPLTVVDDPDPAYMQSNKMSHLARCAADRGAAWVVPFDADELWVFEGDRIANELGRCNADVVTAELHNYFPSAIDPPGTDPFATVQWRQRDPAPLPKVAFRWETGCVIHQGNHGVTRPSGGYIDSGLRVSHFPYRSPEQFVRKARNGAEAYKATNLPPDVGAHWRGYGELLERGGEEALHNVFRTYFWHLSPADAGMVLDPAPYRRWTSQ